MRPIQKWKIFKVVSFDEAVDIISEIYGGAKKIFWYDTNEKIDNNLYELYKKFPTTYDKETNVSLYFSAHNKHRPMVSTTEFPEYSHKITTEEEINFYIYE